MSFRRVGLLAAVALATLLWASCGDIYRPVVIPINITPPNSANFHAVFGISANVPFNQGTALQIDVSGDSNIGVANMGVNPIHAAILPNNSRVFVASAGSLFAGDSDVVTAFYAATDSSIATGLGTPTTFSFPNVGTGQSSSIVGISEAGNLVTITVNAVLSNAIPGAVIAVSGVSITGYNGNFLISSVNGTTIQYQDSTTGLAAASGGTATVPVVCSYLPDFVASAQNTSVYVANYGVEGGANCNVASTDSVALLNPVSNTIDNIAYLPGGTHPVAMAETPDGLNLYVLNQGNNTVTDLSPIDLSTLAIIPVGNTPAWAAMRVDGKRLYVVTQGDGQLYTVRTGTNALASVQSVGGPGANFAFYDKSLNRLYVTNPSAATVYVFDATSDSPTLMAAISLTTGTNAPCPGGCSPVSVTALPDGSRFYVASYQSVTACPDPNIGPSLPCVIPRLTEFDARSLAVKPASSSRVAPSLPVLMEPQFAPTQYAVPVVSSCVAAVPYTPSSTRFRMFTTAAADGSHVYVSICDAGSIADINTAPSSIATGGSNAADVLVSDLTAPFGVCTTPAICSNSATIRSFSITSNVVTFHATNTFVAGQRVQINGLTTGTYLDGQTLTVLPTGLSGSQFESHFASTNVGSTNDSGTATPVPPPQNPVFLLTGQ